jgi:hypothetical protein
LATGMELKPWLCGRVVLGVLWVAVGSLFVLLIIRGERWRGGPGRRVAEERCCGAL